VGELDSRTMSSGMREEANENTYMQSTHATLTNTTSITKGLSASFTEVSEKSCSDFGRPKRTNQYECWI